MDENLIVELEKDGVVTATFRKLPPTKKTAVYRAALSAFASASSDRTALDGIAHTAGVSKGSLFQYFTHKDNLLAFVTELFFDEYQQFWESYLAREQAVRVHDRMLDYVRTLEEYWTANPVEAEFCLNMLFENGGELSAGFRAHLVDLHRGHVTDIVARGINTGEIRRDLSRQALVDVLLAVLLSLNHTIMTAPARGKKARGFADREAVLRVLFSGMAG
ncbi:MAG: TetR/AcrR family transcriptional regulator [candidate division Zixibacteria bacterium]|nr:TetR/AcrR family transcriptional regulator [candidate division Zixibacteria bacterium]